LTQVPVVASSAVTPSGTAPQAGTPGTSISVAYPTGVQVGDVLLLAAANGAPNTNSTPSSWTSLQAGTSSADTTANVYWKVAVTADTSASTVAITHTAAGTPDVPVGAMVRLNTTASSSQIHSSQVSTGGSAATTSPTLTALSPAPSATDLVVRFYFCSVNNASTYSAITSPGGTWALLQKQFTNTGSDFNCGIVVASKTAGTDNQTLTATASGSNTSGWVVIDVAVVGAPDPVSRPRILMPYRGAVQRAVTF